MKFIGTVISAAILIVLIYLLVAFLVDGYFGGNIYPDDWTRDTWAAPDSWSEWRDIMLVFLGALFVLGAIVWLAVAVAVLFLVFAIRGVIRNNAAPALDSLKETLDNVKGTAEFVGETTVAPIVRVYSIVRGVRNAMGAVTGIGNRVRRRRK
jgi:hypothetical protein